jgi:hypothetical protein
MKILHSRIEYLTELKNLLPISPICVEIGVADGYFSKQIFNVFNPDKLFLIDPWKFGHDKNDKPTYGASLSYAPTSYSTSENYDHVIKYFYDQIKNNRVIVRSDYSYNVVNDFPDNYFDFIYIDACHLYNCVKSDLNNYLPKLKSNGLMCGHDYLNFDEFGVIQAVDEFCVEHNFEMIIFNDTNGCDWVLKRR